MITIECNHSIGGVILKDLWDWIVSLLTLREMNWLLRGSVIIFFILIFVMKYILLKYKDGKKTFVNNFNVFIKDLKTLSATKRIGVIILLALIIILVLIISYQFRETNYDTIALANKDGKIIYPIGVDILKEERVDDITFFTYNVRESIDDEEISYPALFRWENGKLAERVSKLACPHFEIAKKSVIYLNSTLEDLSHGQLYVARPDGLNARIQDEEIYNFVIDNDYIYYSYCFDTTGVGFEGHALHRMDLNGENITIVAFETSSPILREGSYHNIKIEDGWAIYGNFKIKLQSNATGLEKVVMLENYNEEWIYYTSNKLIKAKPDGSEQVILDDEESFYYNIEKIEGDWIYYTKGNSDYKIDKEGNNLTLIPK